MITTRPSTARALAYLHCQPVLCTWNFETPKHCGQFWSRLLFIVIRNPLASGIVDPIGSLIGTWCDILQYVLPSNACLLEFVIAIGFEMLACKVYKRWKKTFGLFLDKQWDSGFKNFCLQMVWTDYQNPPPEVWTWEALGLEGPPGLWQSVTTQIWHVAVGVGSPTKWWRSMSRRSPQCNSSQICH